MQNLSAPFIVQEECRMKLEHVLFSSIFSKLRICMSEGNFLLCSGDPNFGTNKHRILEIGSWECAHRENGGQNKLGCVDQSLMLSQHGNNSKYIQNENK